MEAQCSFIYNFDLCGLSPYLRILNKDYYQTKLSLIISIILFLFSILFSSYSIYDYINQTPNVNYYKLIDKTNKTIYMNDIFIAFRFDVYNETNIEKNIQYFCYFENETDFYFFPMEPCELGKNIDYKFKDLVENYNKNYPNYLINNYYCINYNNTNIVYPFNEKDRGTFEIYGSCSKNISENLYSKISFVVESDLIDTKNKNKQISKDYHIGNNFFSSINNSIDLSYEFQYIKYVTDNGLFFQKLNEINAIQFSRITHEFDKEKTNFEQFEVKIELKINKMYFDYYYRSYEKIQSAITDILNIVNLIFTMGTKISFFILKKYMSKDIIKKLMFENEIPKRENHKTFHINKILSAEKKIKENEEKNNINSENMLKRSNIIETNLSTKLTEKPKHGITLLQIQKKEAIINKINYFDVVKSIVCCRYKNNELFEICNKIVHEDICIDNIIKRIYKLERLYYIIPKQRWNKIKLDKNKRFKDINNFLQKFDNSKKIKKKK